LEKEHRLRVFCGGGNVFEPKREDVRGNWAYLYSQSIIRIIKPRRMAWEERVARMEKRRGAYTV
jgi:hypothetical protein